MKRSGPLSLILMGSLALGVTGCSSDSQEEEQFAAYSSVEECVRAEIFAPDECRSFAVAAVQQNPRFSSQEECEAEFGVDACGQASGAPAATSNSTVDSRSRSGWSPFLTGFLISRFMGGSGFMQGAQPLYRDTPKGGASGSGFRTRGGETVSPGPKGQVSNPSSALRQSATHTAKPVTGRSGTRSSGGFSGNKKFGSSGS